MFLVDPKVFRFVVKGVKAMGDLINHRDAMMG
jgi:hypothetical protein